MEDTAGTPPGGDPYEKYAALFVAFVMLAAFASGVMNTLVGQIAR
jgi:hypothetical protein